MDTEETIGMQIMKEVGVGLEKDNTNIAQEVDDRSSSRRSRSGSRVCTDRDKIRCYKCREYDHFAKDCPTTKTEKETDQMQQMLNLDEEQTSLKHWQQTHMIVLTM